MLICDGDYLLHRCIRQPSTAELKTSDGRRIGGVFGILRSLRATMSIHIVNAVFVVFGRGRSPRRLQLFPDYKRTLSKPKELAAMPAAERVADQERLDAYLDNKRLAIYLLSKLKCRVHEAQYEADDAIAWLARTCTTTLKNPVLRQCLIMSDDRDMLPLVTRGVSIYRPMADEYIHHENFEELTGLPTPAHHLLFKAIVGGHDNIQGVPNVGEGTVRPILQQLLEPTIDGLAALLPHCKGRRPALILADLERVRTNLDLVDMARETLEPEEQDRLLALLTDPPHLDLDKVDTLLERLEFRSLLEDRGWLPAFQTLR